MKFLIISFIIGLASLSVQGQKRQVSKIISEIESNNLVEAKSKIDLFEQEEGKSAEVYFVKYLYFKSGAASIDFLDSAYVNFFNAFQALSTYELKEKEKVCKSFAFCESEKDSLFSSLEYLIFKGNCGTNYKTQIVNFMKKYPNSNWVPQGIHLVDSIDYEQIRISEDIPLFETYLAAHRNAKFNALAQDRIYTIAYAQASEIDQLEKYEAFLLKYPNAPQVDEAKTQVIEKKWSALMNNPSIADLESFLAKYPACKYSKEGKLKLEEMVWKEAQTFDTPSLYKDFIVRFPNSEKVAMAKSLYELKRDDVLPYLTKDKKYALYDIESKTFVNEQRYEFMSLLDGGKFIVAQHKKFGVIDRSGKIILPITYNGINRISGYLSVKLGDKTALYTMNGEKKLDFIYDDIYQDSEVIIAQKNGPTDTSNSVFELYQPDLTKLFNVTSKWVNFLSNTLFVVNQNYKYYLANRSGMKLSALYDDISFSNDQLLVVSLKNKRGVISTDGKVIIPPMYKYLSVSDDFKYLIATNELDQDAILSPDGKVIYGFQKQSITYLGHSLFSLSPIVETEEEFLPIQLYNATLKSTVKCEGLTQVDSFQKGYASAYSKDRRGIIDSTGHWIVPALYSGYLFMGDGEGEGYEGMEYYEDEMYTKEDELNAFYADLSFNNREFVDHTDHYESADIFRDGLAQVELDGAYGFVNQKGEVAIPIIYSYASDFYKGIAEVMIGDGEDSKSQIIDTKGAVIVENAEIIDYFQNDTKVMITKDEKHYVLTLSSMKITPLTSRKDYESIDYTKDFFIGYYKDVNVILLPTGQELMDENIDFSAYDFKQELMDIYAEYSSGNYDEAIMQYKGALQKHPNNFKILYQLYRCYNEKGDSYNAKYYLNKAIEIDPNSDELKRERVYMSFESKNWSDVIRDVNDILMNSTDMSYYDGDLFFKRAYAYAEQSNYSLAIADYTAVIKIWKTSHAAYNNRGVIYMETKNYTQALNDYNMAIKYAESEKSSDLGMYYSNKGGVLYNLNKKSEACLCWRKSVTLGYSQANSSILRFCK
jgi:tetratricopeptide (TPR) repeat protein